MALNRVQTFLESQKVMSSKKLPSGGMHQCIFLYELEGAAAVQAFAESVQCVTTNDVESWFTNRLVGATFI